MLGSWDEKNPFSPFTTKGAQCLAKVIAPDRRLTAVLHYDDSTGGTNKIQRVASLLPRDDQLLFFHESLRIHQILIAMEKKRKRHRRAVVVSKHLSGGSEAQQAIPTQRVLNPQGCHILKPLYPPMAAATALICVDFEDGT